MFDSSRNLYSAISTDCTCLDEANFQSVRSVDDDTCPIFDRGLIVRDREAEWVEFESFVPSGRGSSEFNFAAQPNLAASAHEEAQKIRDRVGDERDKTLDVKSHRVLRGF
jgi:hypothetical protein